MALKIIIVDDEVKMVEGMKEFFELMGHAVFGCYNGGSALEVMKKEAPLLALCDLNLKDSPVTGLDVVKEITEKYPQTKVIIMTGYGGEQGIRDMCMKYNPFMYLDKPVDLAKIQEAIEGIDKNQ